MKRLSVMVLILSAAWLAVPSGQGPNPPQSDYVPGEILIKFSSALNTIQRDNILAGRGATRIRRFAEVDIDHARIPGNANAEAVVAALRAVPGVVSADLNYIRHTTANPPPNDPFWLNDSLWGMIKIQAQQAWGISTGNSGIIIADIDTGVNYNHVDLAANMWQNPLEIPNNNIDDDGNGWIDDVYGIDTVNNDGNPIDDNAHGTHTSGTAAAVGNNATGVVGVVWNAKILACKFLAANGFGSDAGAAACFNYIVAMRNRGENIRVSTNSWGGGGNNPTLQAAIDAAGNVGIINMFAAGNTNPNGNNNDVNPFYPASFNSPSIVAVAASDQNDNRASFSHYGQTSVDLAAPGVGICSTVLGQNYSCSFSGTSMATPHVAGAAALLVSINPSLTVAAIKSLLMNNVDVLPQWNGLTVTGGRLNVFRAANAAGGGRVNMALPANGGSAIGSSTFSSNYPASATNNGDRLGTGWGSGTGGWNDATAGVYPDSLEVDFNGSKLLDEINVITLQDNFAAPVNPTLSMTFSQYGITHYQVQFWTGSAWQDIPGGVVTNNTNVWRQFLGSVTTTRIRVLVNNALNGYSRIVEVEAWGVPAGGNPPPTVSITAPTEGQNFTAPVDITVSANASDSDGIQSVAFYQNGSPIGSPDTVAPYSVLWSGVTAGNYTLTAVATDNLGAQATSAEVHITVNNPSGRVNMALPANGGSAIGSSTFSSNYPASAANNGDRLGTGWGSGTGGWNDATAGVYPDSLEVDFNGSKLLDEINVITLQDNFAAPVNPTLSMTFSQYGITHYQVQFWTGSAWQDIPGGVVTNNTNVWRQFLGSVTTTRIRALVNNALNGYSRIVEVEAWGVPAGGNPPPTVSITAPTEGQNFTAPVDITVSANASDSDGIQSVAFYQNGSPIGSPDTVAPYSVLWSGVTAGNYTLTAVATDNLGAQATSVPVHIIVNNPAGRVNMALPANGGSVMASSTYNSNYPTSAANNGDRRGTGWGNGTGGWNDATAGVYPDSLEVDFNGSKTLDEINVVTLQDNYAAPVEPTLSMTFTLYGIRNFQVQYWNGSTWLDVPNGGVTNNNNVWRQFLVGSITTTKIRVYITDALNGFSRITEVEAWGTNAGSGSSAEESLPSIGDVHNGGGRGPDPVLPPSGESLAVLEERRR